MDTTIGTLEERIKEKAEKIVLKRRETFINTVQAAFRELDPSHSTDYNYYNPFRSSRAKSILEPLMEGKINEWPQDILEAEIEVQRSSLLATVEEIRDLVDRVEGLEPR